MLSQPQSIVSPNSTFSHNADPFVMYSRSLHDYTLRLWTESRRLAEEKTRAKAAKQEEDEKSMGSEPSQSQP